MNSTRPMPRGYFTRNGRELTGHKYNGKPVGGLGIPTGMIGNLPCFQSVMIESHPQVELTERDFGGQPVRCKVWTPNGQPLWVGIANATTVDSINEAKSKRSAKADAVVRTAQRSGQRVRRASATAR